MTLFETGRFTMASGQIGWWKIECDALTDDDWNTLALMARDILPPYGDVVGVPRGGLKFASALRHFATGGPRLVADDVYTTGKSLGAFMEPEDIGCVAFARSPTPQNIFPVFLLSQRRTT